MQQRVAPQLLGRTTAFTMTGSFALGSLGWTVIGSVASLVGAGRLLGFAAAYATVSSAVVLATPAIRAVRWQDMARRMSPKPAGVVQGCLRDMTATGVQ